MHILVVEDDEALAGHIVGGLTQAGHLVDRCADGRDGLVRAMADPFDVIVLDRMLPSVSGLKVLAALRAADNDTPVLLMSALGDVDERVKGLNAGGDDYLAKPFSFAELLARVEALGRRRAAVGEAASVLRIGDLEIDLPAHTVRSGGRRIELTTREFRILACLARSPGRVVTRTMLLEDVWDYNFDPQTNIIDQHISNLRQKLDPDRMSQLIRTVRGAGYMLRA